MSSIIERLNTALEGRYRVERELGEGGMATVYLAEDLRHQRNVAVKVLRPELAAVVGGDRFLAEIQTTANLQHPHILPLFDSGEADSFLFYVMPYVGGESLREKLDREKQLRVEDALSLTRKVADALDYAHGKGVVHRDIKPANILLSERGEPLVADFGIALAVSQAGAGRITETGLSLGTPHYMSPEQATGDRDVDPRSDVYALGCVLYEMLAGQPPFAAPTAQAVLARILTEEPRRVTELRRTVPGHVGAVLERALEKLPADRFESASDLKAALEDEDFQYRSTGAVAPVRSLAPEPEPVRPATRRSARLVTAGAVAVLALLGIWGWIRPEPPAPVRRFAIVLDSMGAEFGPAAVLSPDGSHMVYVGSDRQLWVRPLQSLEARPLPGTAGGRTPFFSPDGDGVGFHAGSPGSGRLSTLSLGGAPPVDLFSGLVYPGATWSDDGYVYYADPPGTLYRVAARGGQPEVVADRSDGYRVAWPEALPAPHGVLATAWSDSTGPVGIVAIDPATGERTLVLQDFTGGQTPDMVRYAGGHLFWTTLNGMLMAAPFDLESLTLSAPPSALASNVLRVGARSSEFDVADDGTLTYVQSPGTAPGNLGENMAWSDRAGSVTVVDPRLAADAGDFDYLSLSPDGRYIAAEVQAGGDLTNVEEHHVWIYDLGQGTFVRLTLDGRMNTQPRWLDERTVVFLSDRDGPPALYAQRIDGRQATEFLRLEGGGTVVHFDITGPDDPVSLTLDTGSSGEPDADIVWARPGTREVAGVISATRFPEVGGEISPDGGWVAYTSSESGRAEVYVSRFPDGGRGRAISTAGGSHPFWSPDGSEIFYEASDGDLMVAELDGDLRVRSRGRLFDLAPFEPGVEGFASFDIDPATGRFLMIAEATTATLDRGGRRVVVLNVFEELRVRD